MLPQVAHMLEVIEDGGMLPWVARGLQVIEDGSMLEVDGGVLRGQGRGRQSASGPRSRQWCAPRPGSRMAASSGLGWRTEVCSRTTGSGGGVRGDRGAMTVADGRALSVWKFC
jgi:hypothetical protein